MNAHRINIIGVVQMLASTDEQDVYRSRVPVNIVDELICQWFDDLYHPGWPEFDATFSPEELARLSQFNQFLDQSVPELPIGFSGQTHSPVWNRIVSEAQSVLKHLGWAEEAK